MTQKETTQQIGWNFDNSYAGLPKSFFTILNPTAVPLPKLIIFNDTLATSLGLNHQQLQTSNGVAVLAGNEIPKGALPLAQAYAGDQFGYFTMLGDGRAVLLGEQITPKGERFDIQLKGSGKTPYSRGGDGRAALGPMLREYIISEAMHGLGIATTRSLAVVTTGESIIRESKLAGAILTRVASSHLRVGTFQYISNWGTTNELKALADYAIERHFPNVDSDNAYLFLLKQVIRRQAELIAKWQLIGFIHGVMNTDNMTISGETIDYGPCAFMDSYNLETVFSSIDTYGRYAYGNQPSIAKWNLARFAKTLLPLLHDNKEEAINLAREAILEFNKIYDNNWLAGMRAKLGIFNEELEDKFLIKALLSMMQKYQADYTNTFLALTFNNLQGISLFDTTDFRNWHELWQERLTRGKQSEISSHELMRRNNPALIPRNHRVEEALEAATKQGDYNVMKQLLHVLSCPYAHTKEQAVYAVLPSPSTIPYRTFCGT